MASDHPVDRAPPRRELLFACGCVVAGVVLLGIGFLGTPQVWPGARAVVLLGVVLGLRGLFDFSRLDVWLAVGVSLVVVFGAMGVMAATNAARTDFAAWERPDPRQQAALATRAKVFLLLGALGGALAAYRARRALHDGSAHR